MNEIQRTKAVIYARYSSHSQTEQSIEGQLRDAYEYAKQNNMTVINEYIDRAQTGTKDDRPDFQRMMADAPKKQFSVVLVWKLDRFARNRFDSATYRAKLKKYGIKVVSVKENIADGAEGIILESVLEGMAEYYSVNLSENIKRGIRESAIKGWFPGGPIPFGYIHQDHHLVPNPQEAPIVREIFERYVAGEKPTAIVRDFSERGMIFKHGREFQISTIAHITENPVYAGHFCHGEQLIEGCATPIISQELFDAATARRSMNRRAPAANRKPNVNFLLVGKLFCGECGKPIAGDGGTSKNGKYYSYYTCSGRKKNKGCTLRSFKKDEIEYAVCKIISDFLLDKRRKTIELVAQSIFDIYHTNFEEKELQEMEAQYKKINLDLEKLVDSLMEMPESARPRIATRMEKLEKQLQDLDVRISKKRLECGDVFSKENFIDYFRTCMKDFSTESRQEFIIRTFLNSAYIYEDGMLVVYLNQVNGIPNAYKPDDDPKPGKGGFSEGRPLFPNGAPQELCDFPDIEVGSSLYTYAPPYADKLEPKAPHLFFLHGRIGIVVWRQDVCN